MMELRNRSVTCLVTLPDSVALAVDVDRNSEGREVLIKVCENLRILEVDYFGLVYHGVRGEELWLNLRNRLSAELSGTPPYRLILRVKFFTEPHFIQQDATRDQFFLNARQQFLSEKFRFTPDGEVINLAALLCRINQVELSQPFKGFVPAASVPDYQAFLPSSYQNPTFSNSVMVQCSKLESLSSEVAKNNFLKTASSLLFFGIHLHEAKDESGKDIHIGVSQRGILGYGEAWIPVCNWNWDMIQSATHNALSVTLNTVQDDGVVTTHCLKLSSRAAANALYRDMTEIYSFYHCDTIGSVVSEQYCRDLKGTIVSFFNESTCLGKRYVFDIQRTLREAYDYARRILYTAERRVSMNDGKEITSISNGSTFDLPEPCQTCSSACQAQKRLNEIHKSLVCHICADTDINTVFVPCGHVVSCAACAKRLDCCPICKSSINLAQPVYLPYTNPVVFGPQAVATCS